MNCRSAHQDADVVSFSAFTKAMLPYPNITATPKGARTLVYQHIINHLFHSDLITSLICQLVSHSLFVCLRLTSVILFTPVTSSLTIHSLVMATLLLQPIHLPIMHVYPPAPGIYIHQPMIPQSQNLNQNRNRILQISSQNSLYIFITLHVLSLIDLGWKASIYGPVCCLNYYWA